MVLCTCTAAWCRGYAKWQAVVTVQYFVRVDHCELLGLLIQLQYLVVRMYQIKNVWPPVSVA